MTIHYCFVLNVSLLRDSKKRPADEKSIETRPSNDPVETQPRQGKRMTYQENLFPHQV